MGELVGDGHVFASGDCRGLIGQRNSTGHVGVDPADTSAMRAALLERFAGWNERLLAMISENDGPYVNRPSYAIPAPHVWEPTAGVTPLGDAGTCGHPSAVTVSTWRCSKATMATALAEHATVDAVVRAYEQLMPPRNAEVGDDIATVRAVFAPGERDLDSVPDFDKAAEGYKRRAAEYAARSH